MVRRLERRTRQAPPQSLSHETRRHQPPNPHAKRHSKKRTPGGQAADIARDWLAPQAAHRNYRCFLRQFETAVGQAAPRQITQATINGLTADWRNKYSRNTLHCALGFLKRLLKNLQLHGAPALAIGKVPGPKPRENTATQTEAHRMIASAPIWLRLFILLCLQTALRFSEAWSVTPRSFNEQSRTIGIRTKGGKFRVIPTTPEIEQLIRPTLQDEPDKPCIAILKGTRCSPSAVRRAWRTLACSLGISHLNPHDLRRTTATNLYRTSKDLRAVQQFLGHDSLTSTLTYLAPLEEEKLREYQQLLNFHTEVKQ